MQYAIDKTFHDELPTAAAERASKSTCQPRTLRCRLMRTWRKGKLLCRVAVPGRRVERALTALPEDKVPRIAEAPGR